eukprot:TRINITY_DN12197_c0_g1_i1.p1 TRINITY_DN12197_c0_g1~~TRINITY_DN12197_c0_g1_i1.p1  ORF type:complete len:693 (+),score=156.64 TRINITY_DN12197_c0_g1_i1:2-2080(+)
MVASTKTSEWPLDKCNMVRRPHPKVPPQILSRVTWTGRNMGHAANVLDWGLMQAPYPSASLNPRTPSRLKGARRGRDPDATPMNRQDDLEGVSAMVPKRYRKVKMTYSQFGVEDFDFAHYNQTPYCGLEMSLPNAYCNALLQVLFFIGPIRAGIASHSCHKEFCLTCELAFLFDMLNQQPGRNCQATNFIRCLRTIPQAINLGLVLNDETAESPKTDLQALAMRCHTFILSQVNSDTRLSKDNADAEKKKAKGRKGKNDDDMKDSSGAEAKDSPAPSRKASKDEGPLSPVEATYGTKMLSIITCSTCNNCVSNSKYSLCHSLRPPDGILDRMSEGEKLDQLDSDVSFRNLVGSVLYRHQMERAHCSQCGEFKLSSQSRAAIALPPVLALSIPLPRPVERDYWAQANAQFAARHNSDAGKSDRQHTTEAVPIDPELKGEPAAPRPLSWIPAELEVGLQPRSPSNPIRINEKWLLEDGKVAPATQFGQTDASLDDCRGKEAYELTAAVFHIRDSNSAGNIVTVLRVPEEYHADRTGVPVTPWLLLNDFALTVVSQADALSYDMAWKTPVVFYYSRKGYGNLNYNDFNLPQRSLMQKLLSDNNLSSRKPHKLLFTPLSLQTVPKQGDLVAIDAEFISLRKEDAELRSSGHRNTLKPAQMTPARVSLVAGSGQLRGCTIVDDYIKNTEFVGQSVAK